MTVQSTSLLVFIDKIRPELTKREKEVIDALELNGGEGSISGIQKYMNRPEHCYSGRFTALQKKEYIYDTGKKELNNNGNWCIVWGVMR